MGKMFVHCQKDLLQYRASPYIHRQIDWDPIKTVKGWKNQNIYGTSLTLAITKAEVESRKFILGIGSYGRSFQPVNINMFGPNVKFTGSRDHSNASPGKCTNTAGYISNAEISEIVDGKVPGASVVENFYDKLSDSQIVTYTDNGNSIPTVTGGIFYFHEYKYEDEDKDDDGGSQDCPNNVKSFEEVEKLPDQCASYGAVQALNYKLSWVMSRFNYYSINPNTRNVPQDLGPGNANLLKTSQIHTQTYLGTILKE